jgi:hypothetical protein
MVKAYSITYFRSRKRIAPAFSNSRFKRTTRTDPKGNIGNPMGVYDPSSKKYAGHPAVPLRIIES